MAQLAGWLKEWFEEIFDNGQPFINTQVDLHKVPDGTGIESDSPLLHK